jgi:hypothetical protein
MYLPVTAYEARWTIQKPILHMIKMIFYQIQVSHWGVNQTYLWLLLHVDDKTFESDVPFYIHHRPQIPIIVCLPKH